MSKSESDNTSIPNSDDNNHSNIKTTPSTTPKNNRKSIPTTNLTSQTTSPTPNPTNPTNPTNHNTKPPITQTNSTPITTISILTPSNHTNTNTSPGSDHSDDPSTENNNQNITSSFLESASFNEYVQNNQYPPFTHILQTLNNCDLTQYFNTSVEGYVFNINNKSTLKSTIHWYFSFRKCLLHSTWKDIYATAKVNSYLNPIECTLILLFTLSTQSCVKPISNTARTEQESMIRLIYQLYLHSTNNLPFTNRIRPLLTLLELTAVKFTSQEWTNHCKDYDEEKKSNFNQIDIQKLYRQLDNNINILNEDNTLEADELLNPEENTLVQVTNAHPHSNDMFYNSLSSIN